MKATAIALNLKGQARLLSLLAKTAPSLELSSFVGGIETIVDQITNGECSLLVAEVDRMDPTEREAISEAIRAFPTRSVLLISNDYSVEFLLWAMRSGVAEIVPAPADVAELGQAILRQLKRNELGTTATIDKKSAEVVAFLPAKGGSGATFLATNVAAALAARGKRVALIDLNLNLGDAALFLTEDTPVRSIADVCHEIDRLDADLLEASMTCSMENLWILPAPESPEAGIEIDPDAVEKVIALARERFDMVIVDAGRVLDARILRGLDVASTIYMVMQLALPNVHDAKRLKAVFDGLGYANDKLKVIVNRYERGTDIGVTDVEKALNCSVALKVPNDFKTVTYAINHAIPVFHYRKRGSVTDSVYAIADKINPSEKPVSGLRKAFGLGAPLAMVPSRG